MKPIFCGRRVEKLLCDRFVSDFEYDFVLNHLWRNTQWILKINLDCHQIIRVYRFQRPILNGYILRFNHDIDTRRIEVGVVKADFNSVIK